MNAVVKKIRKELKEVANKKTKESGKRFFKEPIKLYGVKSALVTSVAKKHHKEITQLSKKEVFAVCEELWQSGYIEESLVACNFAYSLRKQFTPADFKTFEHWIDSYITNWASCDTFCNHTMGVFLEMYPQFLKQLLKLARSKNRWARRAAAVSLIMPARNRKFHDTVFAIADIELSDNDDMVQKGYGWALKVTSQKNEQRVFDYVMRHKNKMPRTALRYAIEKMPQSLKKLAMKK